MTRFSRPFHLSPCWKKRSERSGEIAYLFMNVGGKSNPQAEIKSHFRSIFFNIRKGLASMFGSQSFRLGLMGGKIRMSQNGRGYTLLFLSYALQMNDAEREGQSFGR